MKKALCILVLMAILLCAGCAKTGPEGLGEYYLGSVWESDGGQVSVVGYAQVQSWEDIDGTLIEPEEGNILILVEVDAKLEDGWEIYPTSITLSSDEVYRDHLLDHGPIPTENGTYALLFEVESGKVDITKLSRYNVMIYLTDSEGNKENQLIYLKEIG